ncbi:NAD(P)-dependent dehydrogenase (short-subunit alcohol dehydrogenase family) [Bradyrhizobium sp. USDA 4524]|uniref:SDR family oxidoreductase n=1 Tax=unclassified Bradyrhizobium TaxID=2631580 RepID=UPI00209DA5DE|nr:MULTISPECIES: SDR family oxidoreductase [unclassified Bradyrhizobium]MCP1838516.1 NAD(P)-dependent dehydrogenase (short-subunit alcohol dehydrogenase family) [Bradyrhizobium sp. USDA 4538]MCP1899080.1 NAD(P)-dependent dehydrogenase (short-subunit alcohol dehydrogenase family) [Bradyrhizobium sp. USDA 4537]MCP1986807.1 NAD(P)-dependent dehydrogenase (short-subunit alcohol dehydrogenase family) [Bradyrhizobium sp. USDA 4539]
MFVSLSLAGRRAIVSAATSGIGRVIAETLAGTGARVEVCGVDEAKIAEMRRCHPAIGAVSCDLAHAADTEQFFAGAVERLGGLDILINNAGIAGPIGLAESMSLEAWNRTLAVNLTSHFLLARLAAPLMRKAGGGAIVNISSTAGLEGNARRSPYNASKWGVIGLTKSLAKELGPSKIRVNVICPGFVEGDRMERVIAETAAQKAVKSEEVRARLLAASSMGTSVRPNDIAAMILFLVSDVGMRLSGHVFVVDADSM